MRYRNFHELRFREPNEIQKKVETRRSTPFMLGNEILTFLLADAFIPEVQRNEVGWP